MGGFKPGKRKAITPRYAIRLTEVIQVGRIRARMVQSDDIGPKATW
jgi:hypothetical protein